MKKYGKFFTLGVFAAAMGILEAAVVVYLRQLYYPAGFDFPIVPIPDKTLFVELVREIVTIVMLVCAGLLAGRNRLQKFAYFVFAFGAWDLFYYAGLKLFLGWPPSFLTWDVLFLIPVTWLGPVLAPMICALTMMLVSVRVVALQEKGHEVKIKALQGGLMALGALIIFYTFIQDHARLLIQNGFSYGFFALEGGEKFRQAISQYVPVHYNWYLFGFGELLVLAAAAVLLKGSGPADVRRP